MSILIADDNEADSRLVLEALHENGMSDEILLAKDGEEVMRMLRSGIRPDLLVLDLNMPRKDGMQVLTELKQDPELLAIPVVVLTTSCSDRDVRLSYQLHANSYVVKPLDIERLITVVGQMRNYWLGVSKAPPH